MQALIRGGVPASYDAAKRALLEWSRAAALTLSRARAADLDRLRGHGFHDAAILDVTLVVAYFCVVNRLRAAPARRARGRLREDLHVAAHGWAGRLRGSSAAACGWHE